LRREEEESVKRGTLHKGWTFIVSRGLLSEKNGAVSKGGGVVWNKGKKTIRSSSSDQKKTQPGKSCDSFSTKLNVVDTKEGNRLLKAGSPTTVNTNLAISNLPNERKKARLVKD